MQRKIVISEGEFYHIYNRGVEKRDIFISQNDYKRFIRLLYLANNTLPYRYSTTIDLPLKDINRGEQLVAIGAWVLMPNHFHILVREIVEGGTAMFMEKLTTGYSTYFNKLNDRVGSLFQGTYKAEHADSDEYLKYLFSYIHLNPVKLIEYDWKESGIKNISKAKKFLSNYDCSSYLDYVGQKREAGMILDKTNFPEYFSSIFDFNDNITDWLEYKDSY
ncbi:MAG: transposase [Minisyncoccia bacterium]